MAAPPRSVLLITLPPVLGGVTAQGRHVADLLARHGFAVTVAWRAFRSDDPGLSVPSWHALSRRPATREVDGWPFQRIAVGTWLPEFEWAHHRPWPPWRALLDAHRRVVVVSGHNLAGLVPVAAGRASLQWIASTYDADRADRVRAWPAWRRAYDSLLNAPLCRRDERRVLAGADTLAISAYTARTLAAVEPRARLRGVVPIPVDPARFSPAGRDAGAGRPPRIGFNGRLSDPRKNLGLLVDAFARLAARHPTVELHLRGDLDRAEIVRRYGGAAVADRIVTTPAGPFAELATWYRALDVFAIPSHQEGLSIVGTEAMACGAAVVSTRCGGPEDFVLDGETGLLSPSEPGAFAARLEAAVGDAALRRRLAQAGAALVAERYAPAAFERGYMAAFFAAMPD